MNNDYSIECAQPYEDSGSNHEETAGVLRDLLDRLNDEEKQVSLVALADDVTYEHKDYFDFTAYTNWLEENGFEPNLVARESSIVDAVDRVLSQINFAMLNPVLRKQLQFENYHISQLFIATWCLLRLGYIEDNGFSASLRAKELINVLPASFKPTEDQSLEIIKATPYSDAVNKIKYRFI